MKIVHIMRQYYPTVGGIQNVVSNLAQNFIKNGHEVDVIALNRLFDSKKTHLPASAVVDKVQIYRVPYWGNKRYPIAPTILEFLKSMILFICIAAISSWIFYL